MSPENERDITDFLTDMDEVVVQHINPTDEYKLVRNVVENLLATRVYNDPLEAA